MITERFITRYGWPAYRNPDHPTADRIIPAAWAFALLHLAPHSDAWRHLEQARATTLGIAFAFADDKSRMRVDNAARRLEQLAAPLLYDSDHETPHPPEDHGP